MGKDEKKLCVNIDVNPSQDFQVPNAASFDPIKTAESTDTTNSLASTGAKNAGDAYAIKRKAQVFKNPDQEAGNKKPQTTETPNLAALVNMTIEPQAPAKGTRNRALAGDRCSLDNLRNKFSGSKP